MYLTPKDWREEKGLNLSQIARSVGISGKNPGGTYRRYEDGQNACPPEIIENVRVLSDGKVGAEAWQRIRIEYLKVRSREDTAGADQ